jgi:Alw26I/Eco31I/Esp3I family type II restriction m6 adenine DNA methyltransferase
MRSLPQVNKDLGIVYTPEDLVHYICQITIHRYLLDKLNGKLNTNYKLESNEIDFTNFKNKELELVLEIIDDITILDPAVGVGVFLISAFKVLERIHTLLFQAKIQNKDLSKVRSQIILKNLYGVDVSEKSVQHSRDALLKLVDVNEKNKNIKQLENIVKFHIKTGNALIGRDFSKEDDQEGVHFNTRFNWDEEFPEILKTGGFSICIGNPPWNILKPLEKEFFAIYDSRISKYGVDKQETKKIIDELLLDKDIQLEWEKYRLLIQKQAKYFRSNYRYQTGEIQIGSDLRKVSGDINLYKLFLERSFSLLQKDGLSGLIIPSGFHNDAGTQHLRKLILEENQLIELFSFENRSGIFPSIHKSFKFDIIIFKKNTRKTKDFNAIFMQRNLKFLHNRESQILKLSWDQIKRFSPSSWSVLEFKTIRDISIAQKMFSFPTLGASIVFTRELDVSMDSHLFNTSGEGYPIFEGKMIEQFTHRFKEPRYWIPDETVHLKFGSEYKDHQKIRLGFRAVAASTNKRTMIASLIPPNSCCGNSIILVKNCFITPQTRNNSPSLSDLYYLLGVFNSFVFDYLLRLKISQNLNMFFIRDMPVPRLSEDNPTFRKVIALVRAIYMKDRDFGSKLKKTDESEQFKCMKIEEIRALLDVTIAKIFHLSFDDLKHILDQFHLRNPSKEEELSIQKQLILTKFAE